jgi:hypothetical protein
MTFNDFEARSSAVTNISTLTLSGIVSLCELSKRVKFAPCCSFLIRVLKFEITLSARDFLFSSTNGTSSLQLSDCDALVKSFLNEATW